MESPMLTESPELAGGCSYSGLQILHSYAGYYIGTVCTDEDGFVFPGSRDSGYFDTWKKADAYLAMVSCTVNPQEYLRDQP